MGWGGPAARAAELTGTAETAKHTQDDLLVALADGGAVSTHSLSALTAAIGNSGASSTRAAQALGRATRGATLVSLFKPPKGRALLMGVALKKRVAFFRWDAERREVRPSPLKNWAARRRCRRRGRRRVLLHRHPLPVGSALRPRRPSRE